MVGFCASVMWSVIFSLALNSVPSHHGSFSGILCTGIVGGAVCHPAGGLAGRPASACARACSPVRTLAYILGIGFWARPLIQNATIRKKESAA